MPVRFILGLPYKLMEKKSPRMDIVISKCSDRFMEHVRKRRDQEVVRWYVLTLPTAGGGRD